MFKNMFTKCYHFFKLSKRMSLNRSCMISGLATTPVKLSWKNRKWRPMTIVCHTFVRKLTTYTKHDIFHDSLCTSCFVSCCKMNWQRPLGEELNHPDRADSHKEQSHQLLPPGLALGSSEGKQRDPGTAIIQYPCVKPQRTGQWGIGSSRPGRQLWVSCDYNWTLGESWLFTHMLHMLCIT